MQHIYNKWLTDDNVDNDTKNELKSLNEAEIHERFYKELEFGTAGLRGIIGAGTNRMNKYTVGKATQGLANFIVKQGGNAKERGVAIAYDSRNQSPEFADCSASVLNASGIKAYVFDALRPTPELSFAVRHLNCISGIVITASHNPPEYNGYKVYWEDGAQVSAPYDLQIMDEVNAVDIFAVRFKDKESAIKEGLYEVIGRDIDDAFTENVKAQVQNPDEIGETAAGLNAVFTPLHGAGNVPVRRVLEELGFSNVNVVKEQELPDKNFTTVGYPNPEDPKVFELGIKLAKKLCADIIIATDPDADRMGVAAVKDGEYQVLTGNMTGILLTHFILDSMKKAGKLPDNAAVVKTIVTTDMVSPICAGYRTKLVEVLTGFKFIGGKIKEFSETSESTYIFGFEESFGYLAGTYARDKDAIVAAMLVCELAAVLKSQGKTLWDRLGELYEKYGYYKEDVKSVAMPGSEGLSKMAELMEGLRSNPPKMMGGASVYARSDYKEGKRFDILAQREDIIDLPKSDVLKYDLADGSSVIVRPSGTEPKIKFYVRVKADSDERAMEKIAAVGRDVDDIAKRVL